MMYNHWDNDVPMTYQLTSFIVESSMNKMSFVTGVNEYNL